MFVELTTALLCVVAAVLIAVQDSDEEAVFVDPWRLDAAYLQGVVAYGLLDPIRTPSSDLPRFLHGILSIFGCLDCCMFTAAAEMPTR